MPPPAGRPLQALDEALAAIATRYGTATARFIAAQLEYAPAAAWEEGS